MGIEVIFILLSIAIMTYYLIKWVVKKFDIGVSQHRTFIIVSSTIFLTPIIYVGVFGALVAYLSYYPHVKFSKEGWDTKIEVRYTMSKDIKTSNMLIGKTREEVVDILGEDYLLYNDDHIGYYLGFVPQIISIDPDILDVYFEDGKVVKVDQHKS